MNLFSANVFEEIAEEFGVVGATAFFKECQSGMAFEQGRTTQYVNGLSEVHHKKSGAIEGLGHVSSEIPADIWHSWNQRYPGFWNDDSNRKWFLNQFPQFKVGYQGKAQVAWRPTLDRTQSGLFIGSKYGNVHPSN